MSTLLQRIARRARETPKESAPHIEPVFASTYGPREADGGRGFIEEAREVDAPVLAVDREARTSTQREPSIDALRARDEPRPSPRTTRASRSAHVESRDEADASAPQLAPELVPQPAPQLAQESARNPAHTMQQRRGVQPQAPRETHMHATIDPLPGIAQAVAPAPAIEPPTATSPHNAPRDEDAQPSRTREQQIAERIAPAFTSLPSTPAPPHQTAPSAAATPVAPTVTISFGRVEVRPANAPAAPPHTPFRPVVSLDAFLRRGGGNRR